MRILIVGNGTPRIPPKSGIPVTIYLHTLAEQLTRLGHEVDVVCPPAPGHDIQKYNLVEVGNPRIYSRNSYLRNIYEVWFSLCFAFRFRGLCRKRQYDIVHFFENPVTAYVVLLFNKQNRHNFLFSSGMAVSGTELTWGVPDKKSIIWRASMALHTYVFRKMPRITASSHRLKDVIIARTGTTADKITVTPFISAETDIFHDGIDTRELRQSLGLNPTDLVVLCLAPVAPYKNQMTLVEAIPAIIRNHLTTRFLFVGETPIHDYYAQIQQYIRNNSLEKYIIFTGYIKEYADLPRYYNLADVYVLLSQAEGNLPKTTLEAMSCGRAIVVSDIPQNREGAIRGDEMLIINPYNVEAVASTLNQLLTDPELRRQLGENARRTITDCYTPEVIAKRMVELYKRKRANE